MKGKIYLNVFVTFSEALQLSNDLGKKIPTLKEALKINPGIFPGAFWTSTGEPWDKDAIYNNRGELIPKNRELKVILIDWEK